MITNQPTDRLVGFIHHLRDEGFNVGIREIMDMLSSLDTESFTDRRYSRNVMRSLACHSRDDWQRFDDLFTAYWLLPKQEFDTINENDSSSPSPSRGVLTGIAGASQDYLEQMGNVTGLAGSGTGRLNTISKADFRFLNDKKAMQEVEQLAEKLALRLNKRISRRQVIQPRGSRIAIRQTIRRNLSYGGHPVRVFYQNRRREPLHIIILHDVSHSMTWNNPLLFRFVRGLVRSFKSCEAFAFHTQLFRVTTYYRERSVHVMKQRLEARNHLWMGGTCIAESLQKFNQEFAAKNLNSRSIVMIISDGFDTNEPAFLARELAAIGKRSKRIIWLNPMLGREGYDPDEPSLIAAKPYIDRLASAHSLDSLKQTIDYIVRDCQ